MNLTYSLPDEVGKHLSLLEGETIWYCSPYDIGEEGEFYSGGYVVITEGRLLVLDGAGITKEIPLSECERIRCESLVDNGILTITRKGEDERVVRFSMKHVARFSYIARGAELLSRGEKNRVISKEKEVFCPKCNRVMRAASCHHCDGYLLTFKRFWKLCGDYQVRMIIVSLFMVLASVISLAVPEVQQRFIDGALRDHSGTLKDVAIFIGKTAFLTSILLLVNLTRNWWCGTLGAGISMSLRAKLYHKIQILSLSVIQKRKPGQLMHRITWDTSNIRVFMEHVFSNMISTLVVMIGAFVAMLVMNPFLTMASTIFIIIVFLLNAFFRKRTRRIFQAQGRKGDMINSALQDVISGIRVVKSFGKEQEEAELFDQKVKEYAAVQKKNEVFWAYFFPLISFIMGVGMYLATYFGGIRVLDGKMSTGELIQFITYTGTLYGPLDWLNQVPRMFRRMVTSLERVYDIMDEESDIIDPEDSRDMTIAGAVEFKNVCFGYRSYEQVLTDINLKVEPGEMIGLVGSSGTGKSTMINLIMRLYDVDQGEILMDGVNIRSIKADSLHSQLGVVLQETFLFTGTILNNIRFAKPQASMEEVIRAAKAANAHDFIVKMPDGYNTYVGEHGYTISGGERQRIAIARAILNDPKLLILDEATSSLDTESEYLIQQALNRLREGRTTFAIAHRLSTLREANRLVVIDNHRIAEVGTHNELIEKQGIYYKLVNAQLEMQKVVGEI